MFSSITVIFITAVISWIFFFLLLPLLSRVLLDNPNQRSSHLRATPTSGGIVFVLVTSSCSLISIFSGVSSSVAILPLISLPLALIGLLDDRFGLPSLWRYLVHLLTSALLLCSSTLVQDLYSSSITPFFKYIALIFLVILASSFINFTNFMDGIDGLVCGCMMVLIGVFTVQYSSSLSLLCLLGSLLGFLFWNWSPASVFMGDVGSTFLGAVLAGLVIHTPTWWDALALSLVATPILGDAALCVLRRSIAGHPVFKPHRLHLFQRLHRAGMPQSTVTSIYISCTLILGLAFLYGGLTLVFPFSLLIILLGVIFDKYFAVPFAFQIKD